MRIFLTGATGFIGGHLLRALAARGHAVTCLARGPGARRIEAMALPGVRVVEGEFTKPETWLAEVEGHEAVVNAVGIIRERRGATFEAVHIQAPIALFETAARLGARKIVQLSAMGADAEGVSRFHRSKRAADLRLAALGVPYVVLRPSLVYGLGDHSMTALLSLAALPITPVPGDGQYRVQPVAVDDLVRALVLGVERRELADLILDLGARQPLTFDALLDTLARGLGNGHGARKLHLPWPLMRALSAITDAMGGRGPITREELGMLRRGTAASIEPFIERFGFEPAPLAVGLARQPRTEALVWHTRLMPLRVPLRLSIAFVWVATGLISAFVFPERQSLSLLAQTGITGALAPLVLYGTCCAELLLGLATAWGYRVRWLGCIELALTLAFTLILTFRIPSFWWHPFGPLTKNLPFMVATLLMMALEE